MKRDKTLNYTRTDDITIEEVKACQTFANVTDEEAQQVIETLKIFTRIMYDAYKKSYQK